MTSDRPSRLTSGSASSSFKSRSSNVTCMAFMWMIHTHPSRGSKHRNRMNAQPDELSGGTARRSRGRKRRPARTSLPSSAPGGEPFEYAGDLGPNEGTVLMVPLRSRRHGAQAHRDSLGLGAQKLVALRVDAARAF